METTKSFCCKHTCISCMLFIWSANVTVQVRFSLFFYLLNFTKLSYLSAGELHIYWKCSSSILSCHLSRAWLTVSFVSNRTARNQKGEQEESVLPDHAASSGKSWNVEKSHCRRSPGGGPERGAELHQHHRPNNSHSWGRGGASKQRRGGGGVDRRPWREGGDASSRGRGNPSAVRDFRGKRRGTRVMFWTLITS